MRRRLVLAVSLAAVLAVLPAGPARAQTTFTFFGSGWGHGVGMSQWGGYGLALDGWAGKDILTHFYSGVVVGSSPVNPQRIRVGILQGAQAVGVEALEGKVQVRIGSQNPAKGTLIGTIPSGAEWTIRESGVQYEVTDGHGELVGGQLWGGTDQHLFLRYVPFGSRVHLSQAGHAYSRGWIELNLYASGSGHALRLIAVVPSEQYLYGVAEVYSGWPDQILRAQAIAARTFAMRRVELLGQHRPGCNCAVMASTLDQVYHGHDKEGGTLGERWVAAVDATSGETLLYESDLILSVYHATSGGHTENVENVWGGEALPYLRGVCDPGDWTPANPYNTWEVTMTGVEAGNMIAGYTGEEIGDVTEFTDVVRGVSGRVTSITAIGSAGTATLDGPDLRGALALRESKVWINQNRNITGFIRTKYDALGCAPGLATSSQAAVAGGLRQRFEEGAIYRNTARAVSRWLHGPLYDKYVEFGEMDSLLGMPRSGVLAVKAVAGATRARFEGGYIYHSDQTGAHALHGPVLDHYLAHGGAAGGLGLPTSDVAELQNGSDQATFQGGTVTCTAGGTCSQS
jgi:SpoIID/LytB domain protein